MHAGLHPGARRHRLHLGARHQRLLPPGADAGRLLRPRLGIPAEGGRTPRPPPACGRWTSTWTPRPKSCGPRSVPRSPRSRRWTATLARSRSPRPGGCCHTCPAVGPGGRPGRAGHHRPGVRHRAGQATAGGHRGVDHSVDRRVRHRGAEAAVSAADLPRRDDLVPAVLRAGRRFGPGRADHEGDPGRRRLAHHRPKDLDHCRAVLAVGRATGQDGPVGAETQRHHLLPAGHEKRRRRGQAAARAHG